MRTQTIAAIEKEKVIAIVRGADPQQCMKIAQALYDGGIRLMEITYNQKSPESFRTTADAIDALAKAFEGRMLIGAGTVTTPELVELTAAAGGKFIISPDANASVIRRTRELGLVSIPGALTPTEIMSAHHAGADFVKLFPVAQLGIPYVKAVTAPISHVKLLAVGGVNENNIADYLNAGLYGAGIGGNLANKKWIEAGEYDKITQTARTIVSKIQEVEA